MKIVDYKKVDMSEAEFDYYKEIVKTVSDNKVDGESYFRGLFDTDKDGLITLIKTNKSIPWSVLFFIQQVQINQRLRLIDDKVKEINNLQERVKKLEEK